MGFNYPGDRTQIGFLFESGAYGTTSGPNVWIGRVRNHTVTPDLNIVRDRFAGTNTRSVDDFEPTVQSYAGTLTYTPQDWKLAVFALGSNVDSGSPSPFIHTISEVEGDNVDGVVGGNIKSFAIEDARRSISDASGLNNVRTLKGCVVDTFAISNAEGEMTEVEINYIAQTNTFSSGAATAITEDTTNAPYHWDHWRWDLPSGTIIQRLKNWNVAYGNNLDARHYANGSPFINQPTLGNRDITMAITVDMDTVDTKNFYDKYFRGGSPFNMFGKGVVSAGSQDVFITLSGAQVVDMPQPLNLEGNQESVIAIEAKNMSMIVNDTTEVYGAYSGAQ